MSKYILWYFDEKQSRYIYVAECFFVNQFRTKLNRYKDHNQLLLTRPDGEVAFKGTKGELLKWLRERHMMITVG